MRIDAHQHFWQYDPVQHAWIDDSMRALRRDFLPRHLRPVLERRGIDGSVAVQAVTSVEETRWLLELAAESSFIKGVVGWVDFLSDDLEEQLEELTGFEALKGFRYILQGQPDGFLRSSGISSGIARLAELDRSYDILIYERQLAETLEMVAGLPEMRLVVDHIAKPDIAGRSMSAWAVGMKRLAQFPHVYVKLSGMVTEADWKSWRPSDFLPYLECVLELFGPDRLMFGSDWPVCRLAADYEEVAGIVEDFVSALGEDEQAAVLGGNSISFYQLEV